MALTPEDVRNKRFTPVRLREGYDMSEVDAFLDEVEAELDRRMKETAELAARLDAGASPEIAAPAAQRPPSAAVADAAEQEPAPPATIPEASGAAARLLELATRNADELMSDARKEADQLLAEARTTAERLVAEAKLSVERMESDARTRSQRLEQETSDRRASLLGQLQQERDGLARELEELRGFEREYRARLKSYLSEQLDRLDATPTTEPPAAAMDVMSPPATPSRLRALLSEED